MANSYLNIITFLITTAMYYGFLKPKLTYSQLSNPSQYESYTKSNYLYLGVYFILIMVVQFGVNTAVITTNCGGSLSENVKAAGFLTFIPWTLIFGVIILVLTVFPGFKSAFSDVIGYYFVSVSANKWLTELLLNQDVSKALKGDNSTPSMATSLSTNATNPSIPSAPPTFLMPEEKSSDEPPSYEEALNMKGGKGKFLSNKTGGAGQTDEDKLQAAADVILKICGNTSILINQMVPSNFDQYWKLLDPLMKAQYRNNSEEGNTLREKLFDLTVTRDNIGEGLWFIYTGLLIVSVVQMKIVTRGCSSNVAAMQQKYQQYKQQEAQQISAQNQATSSTYTITN